MRPAIPSWSVLRYHPSHVVLVQLCFLTYCRFCPANSRASAMSTWACSASPCSRALPLFHLPSTVDSVFISFNSSTSNKVHCCVSVRWWRTTTICAAAHRPRHPRRPPVHRVPNPQRRQLQSGPLLLLVPLLVRVLIASAVVFFAVFG